jgi:hypothetical protein
MMHCGETFFPDFDAIGNLPSLRADILPLTSCEGECFLA